MRKISMKPPNSTSILAVRIAAIVVCLAYPSWMTTNLVRITTSWLRHDRYPIVIALEVVALALVFTIPAAFLWLAWSLWYRWNATTVRWFVGIWMAMLLLRLDMLPIHHFGLSDFRSREAVAKLLEIPLMILGAIAFRIVCSLVIKWTNLPDAMDIYGQPRGHQSRVRFFAAALAFSIWLAGNAIHNLASSSAGPKGWTEFARVFGPAILGYIVYKLIVRYFIPRTQPTLVAGGFEVITNAATTPHGTTLT